MGVHGRGRGRWVGSAGKAFAERCRRHGDRLDDAPDGWPRVAEELAAGGRWATNDSRHRVRQPGDGSEHRERPWRLLVSGKTNSSRGAPSATGTGSVPKPLGGTP